jgi:hypothetical protein
MGRVAESFRLHLQQLSQKHYNVSARELIGTESHQRNGSEF